VALDLENRWQTTRMEKKFYDLFRERVDGQISAICYTYPFYYSNQTLKMVYNRSRQIQKELLVERKGPRSG
jgi:hypothetical protein